MLGFYDDNSTVLLCNQDIDYLALTSLTLAKSAALQEQDGRSGAVEPAVDDSPLLPCFQVSLRSRNARLFVLGGFATAGTEER